MVVYRRIGYCKGGPTAYIQRFFGGHFPFSAFVLCINSRCFVFDKSPRIRVVFVGVLDAIPNATQLHSLLAGGLRFSVK